MMKTLGVLGSRARRRLAPSAALVGGTAMALVAAAGPALAGHSPVADHSPVAGQSTVRSIEIEIEAPVVRAVNGAVVFIPVSVVCSPGPNAELYADITQSVLSVTRTGYGQASTPCDDKVHVVSVPILANRRSFILGKAFARVSAYQYAQNPNDKYLSDYDQEVVSIRLS